MKRFVFFTFTLCLVLVWTALGVADEVETLNAAITSKGASWIAGETSMTKLSARERQKRVGLLEPAITEEESVLLMSEALVALPSRVDWRESKFVTPIRDQGGCGDCWAFATAAASESYTLIRQNTPGVNLDLSEQVLVSCGNSGGCGGGYITTASSFLTSTGLPGESCYAYTATNGSCPLACTNWRLSTYKINKWSYVSNSYQPSTADLIKNALVTYGPLVTTMQVYQDFFSYRSGVYSYVSGSLAGGHAVLIVGYDDASQNFIVKNSWGIYWGESGYFRIAYSQLNSVVKFGEWTLAYGDPVNPPSPPPPVETVTAPTVLTGAQSGIVGAAYPYNTGGAASSVGHSVQYLFDWGDGTTSGWLPSGTTGASKSWPKTGTYSVKTQARCSIDQTTVSSWSNVLTVSISAGAVETVTAPAFITGDQSGFTGTTHVYSTGGSTSSAGHPVEYLFDWGDGTKSGWLSGGATSASKSWANGGTYFITAQARCSIDNTILSSLSTALTVTISATAPTALAVMSPNGGEVITGGTYYTIKWSAMPQGTLFYVTYSYNDGATWSWVATTRATSVSWKVPRYNYSQTRCRIWVRAYDANSVKIAEDKSDSTFTIPGIYGSRKKAKK